MNALLNHVWGKSPAQDRVWAQVTGLRPDGAVRRLLMALNFQAFVDDSRSKDEFVLGGHIATAENWAHFSKEWEELLPFATRDKNGSLRFKMTEMAGNPERVARVEVFYRALEKYSAASISCRMNLDDFEQAYERVQALAARLNWSVDFAKWKNPYYFLFRGLMDRFHDHRETMKEFIPLDEQVDFIFDNQSEKSFILAAWDEIVEIRPKEVQKYYGATPRFEDDLKFLPLQAADLWAWWVREWYEEDSAPMPDKMRRLDFGGIWRGKKPRAVIAISYTEDQIVDVMQSVMFASSQGFRISF
jgi:hypothetical protein